MPWSVDSIGSCTLSIRQRDPRRDDGSFRYIDIASINRDTKQIEEAKEIACEDAPSWARKEVRKDDVLVSTVRPNLNAVAQVPADLDGQIASTGFAVLRPNPKRIHPRYLFFRVITDAFVDDMVAQAKGAGYPAVSDRVVSEHKLPFPPPSEQLRIVEILDQADALRQQRRKANELVQRILPAIRSAIQNHPSSKPYKLSEVADVNWGNTSLTKSSYVECGFTAYSATGPDGFVKHAEHNGFGIVLSAIGARCGKTFRAEGKWTAIKNTITIIPDSWKTNPWVLHALLADEAAWPKRGAAQPFIALGDARPLPVRLPNPKIQDDYGSAIEQITKVQERLSLSATTLETLFQTLLHHAFDGSLTAKWREGHAKELLEEMNHQARA